MHSKISVMHAHEKTQSDPQIKEYLEITASDWFLAQNELTQSPPQSDHQRLPSTGLDVPFWKEGECVDQLIQTAGCMYQTVPTGLTHALHSLFQVQSTGQCWSTGEGI